jgi:hypothetical protein
LSAKTAPAVYRTTQIAVDVAWRIDGLFLGLHLLQTAGTPVPGIAKFGRPAHENRRA